MQTAIIKYSKTIIIAAFFLISAFTSLFSQNSEQQFGNVYVGVYLSDISGFDLKEGRFKGDLQLWCKWLGPEEVPNIQLSNAEIESQELLTREDEGDWHSVRWRIQGTFRGTFPLQKFPFDHQNLKINVTLPESEGKLVPDLSGSGMAEQFSITGWLYEPFFEAKVGKANYYSDFGSIKMEGEPYPVATLDFEVRLSRPFASYIVKFVLPLAIIIIVSVLAMAVPSVELEVRAGMGVTGLLSVVAFQFSLADSIPEVSYIVTADKLFIGAYFIVMVTILVSVIAFETRKYFPELTRWMNISNLVGLPVIGLIMSIAIISNVDRVAIDPNPNPNYGTLASLHSSSNNTLNFLGGLIRHTNTSGIQNGLVRRGLYYRGEQGEKIPHLVAEIPEMTNDLVRFLPDGGMIVIWKLRPNLVWGNGCPITSSDLKWSLGITESRFRDTILVPDELSIEVRYEKRMRTALDAFPLLPKFYLEDIYDYGGQDAVDNFLKYSPPPMDGPFIFQELVPKEKMVFSRNPFFASTRPALDTIKIVGKPKDLSFRAAYEAGIFNACTYVSIPSFNSVKELADVETMIDVDDQIYFLQPDLNIPALANLDYRKAIAHAVQKQNIVDIFYGEEGRTADSYYDEFRPEFPQDIQRYPYSPAKARQLLQASGFKNYPLKVIGFSRGPEYGEYKALTAIVKDLRAAGFNVQLQEEFKSVMRKWMAGNHGGLLLYSRRDPNEVARFWNVPYNNSTNSFEVYEPVKLFDEEMVHLYYIHKNTLFDERRIAVARDIQRLYAKELPTIPLALSTYQTIYKKGLQNLQPTKGNTMWWNVEHWYFE